MLPFHTEHMKIVPVYGDAAAHIVPRVGHLHITVDHASWHWVQSNDDYIVIQGLAPGQHHLNIELTEANHHVVSGKELDIAVP